MQLSQHQTKALENGRVLLLSMEERANDGSIRLSKYDKKAIKDYIEFVDQIRRENGGE